ELFLQGLHQPPAGSDASVEIQNFVAQVVGRVAKDRRLSLELLALAADPVELFALLPKTLVGCLLRLLRALCREPNWARENRRNGDDQAPARRCLPTETELPTSPITVPTTIPMKAMRLSKNTVVKCR